jgi:hypothetical protein
MKKGAKANNSKQSPETLKPPSVPSSQTSLPLALAATKVVTDVTI